MRARPKGAGRAAAAWGYPLLALAALLVPGAPGTAAAQDGVRALEATPIGALPPMALPMPAHRGQNYWVGRLHVGQRVGRDGGDLTAFGIGADLQWHGGSVFGITGGVRTRDCAGTAECDHVAWLAGGRARLNMYTGGPTVGALIGDHNATTTLGAEIGMGYASGLAAGQNDCTVDIGAPVSVALFQKTRVVAFVTPSLVWEAGCAFDLPATRRTVLARAGVGAQQLWHPGLDVYLGFQRYFESGTGHQFGITISYTHLP